MCMTFSSFILSVVSVIITLQVSIEVKATYIDNVIDYCIQTGNEFAATEDKYAEKGPSSPTAPNLMPQQFIEEQVEAYKQELYQRVFECVANNLTVYSNQYLETSQNFFNLVQECKSNQPTTPYCDPSYPYRLIDGTCNNLFNPRWGSTLSCFRRLWPANYEGVSSLRKSVQDGKDLPNARDISLDLIKPESRPTRDYNSLFAFFGQAIAHDVAQFTFEMIHGTKKLDCCSNSNADDPHPQCAPVYLPSNDYFYSPKNVSCFNFVRIIPCSTCSLEKRVQLNYLTAYIDCSLVYGQTDDRADMLRMKDGSGKLTAQHREAGELLQSDLTQGSACGDIKKGEYCFKAGDTRTDQHSLLMMFQTLLLREHNRIVTKLKLLNPHWDDEKLYQEGRKIVIAEFQVIVYNEYLPVLLGPEIMREYGLIFGSGSTYDFSLDPSISVEFNGGAFRIHSILPGKAVFDEDAELLRNLYSNSAPLYNDRMSSYLDKMSECPAEKQDWFMPTDLTLFMYKKLKGTYGFDLGAVDIQRGRDTGVPTYVQVLEYMENRPGTIKSFEDLCGYIHYDCYIIFKQLYADVRDIDLIVGLICEIIPDGKVISWTSSRIVAEQFRRLKYADRFYIEHDRTITDEQRSTLMKASLAKIICDNNKVEAFQPKAFLFPSESNPLQLCSEIPGVDLEKFRE